MVRMSTCISTVSLRVRNPCNDNYQSWGMVVSGSLLPTDFIHSILNRIHRYPKDWRRWIYKPSDRGCVTGKSLNASRLAMSKAWSMLKRQLGSGKISHPVFLALSFSKKKKKECNILLPESCDGLLVLQLHNLERGFRQKKADWQGLWSMHWYPSLRPS